MWILDFDIGIPTFAWIGCWIGDWGRGTLGGGRRRSGGGVKVDMS
jgi:hypothetical protein